MIKIREVEKIDKNIINEVAKIHLSTFPGFSLTFMGRGFLYQLYCSYCVHDSSGLFVAFNDEELIGFLAYSKDLSSLYKSMIRTRLIFFAWYSIGAFFRKPKVFMKLIRAFLKPSEAKRDVSYVELASIGVKPEIKSNGVGTKLIDKFIRNVDFRDCAYITLETDALNNENVNYFYQKNGFKLERTFETYEGRKMNEYRYWG